MIPTPTNSKEASDMNYKINFGDEVAPKVKTQSLSACENLIVICIERGAPVAPYYCWSNKRQVGEWLSEKQIQKYWGIVGSEEYWRKIKAMNGNKK